jgi:hypothetical protein
MASTVGSLFELHSERIVEVINRNVDVILPSLDPVWRDTVVTSQGVGPADAIGRDMNIIKVFQGGMTGVLDQGKPRQDLTLYGDQTTDLSHKVYTQSLTEVWPSPLEGPNQNPYRLAIPMRSMMANIMFTMGELQAEALPATVGEIVAPKLEGFARNISHQLCNYWYVSQNNQFRLTTFTADINQTSSAAWTQFGTTGNFYVDIEPENLATDRFYVGQRVDLYTVTSIEGTDPIRNNDSEDGVGIGDEQSPATRINLMVGAVDELTNKVRLVTPGSPAAWAVEPAASSVQYALVYANSGGLDLSVGGAALTKTEFTGIAGINSWLKTGAAGDPTSDTQLLGDEALAGDIIDVNDHPEHKSFSQNLSGSVLTEHKLRQYLRRFHAAKNKYGYYIDLRRFHAAKNKYGYYIDCLIASDGVWMGYEGTKIGRELLDRTGRLSSLRNEGSDNDEYGGFSFTFDGRNYMGYTSTYVESGVMYGIRKGGNNWKRYVPPDPRGSRNFDRTEPFIPFKFVAGILTGLGTNQLPIYDTASTGGINRVTEGTQMPGMLRMQLVPDQPCGMKLNNVGEDRIYSDESTSP